MSDATTPHGAAAPVFDPRSPAVVAHPGPAYAALRAEGPAWRSPEGFWIVAGHAEVTRLLRDRALSSAQPGGEPGAPLGTLAEHGRWVMVASDPPEHPRRRGALQPEFAATAIAALAPRIEAHVDHLLDHLLAPGAGGGGGSSIELDFVPAVAEVVPALTITELLGLPAADAPRIRAWTAALTDGLEPWGDDAAAERAGRALDEMTAYLAPIIDERRADSTWAGEAVAVDGAGNGAGDGAGNGAEAAASGRDLLTVLATHPDLGPDEALQNGLLMMNAGLDTSADLLATLVVALATEPGLWPAVQADPVGLGAAAVEEAIRRDSPVQFVMRRTRDELVLTGAADGAADGTSRGTADGAGSTVTIPAGEAVLLGIGAANLDPAAHDDPDRFDVHRRTRHVGFGGGAHLCLGAPLARLEAAAVTAALMARLERIELVGPAPWRPRTFFRGRASVPLRLTPRADPPRVAADQSSRT